MLLKHIESRHQKLAQGCGTSGQRAEVILRYLVEHKRIRQWLRRFLGHQCVDLPLTGILSQYIKSYESTHPIDYHRMTQDVVRGLGQGSTGGIAGISFVVPAAKPEGSDSINVRKLESFLEWLGSLDSHAKARFLKNVCCEILNSLDKKALQSEAEKHEKSMSSLKWIFLAPFDRCNLNCLGCASLLYKKRSNPSYDKLDYIVAQAKRLNIFSVNIIGKGEPFFDKACRELLFNLAKKHRNIRFNILTNGTLINEEDIVRMKRAGNLIPFVSIDGLKETNDRRRGTGVYERLTKTFHLMKKHQLLYCFSTMVHKQNYLHVTSSEFIDTMVEFGHRMGVFCQYDPVGDEVDRYFILNSDEMEEYGGRLDEMNRRTDIPLRDYNFMERSQGCLARRGVSVYIDCFTGSVMPCFKTPYAPKECNLFVDPHKNRLFEILNSDFFTSYRNDYFDGRQCFSDMTTELDWFMERSDISASDKKDISDYQELFKTLICDMNPVR